MADMVSEDFLFFGLPKEVPPKEVPPRIVVNQSELQDDDDDDDNDDSDDTQLPLLMLKKMSNHAFMEVISNLPLRIGGTFIANYACRRLNRILGITARLVPLAYDPSQSSPWYIMVEWGYRKQRVNGIPWAYDPISNGWYKFPLLSLRGRQNWMWKTIASTHGLVCAPSCSSPWDYETYKLEVFDPYTQRSKTLPTFENTMFDWNIGEEQTEFAWTGYTFKGSRYPNFSVNIWMIDPATCKYKVIVMRCMTHIENNSKDMFIDSYDRTHSWEKRLGFGRVVPPGFEMQGSNSAICNDILYNIFQNTSLDEPIGVTLGCHLFLHIFDLHSHGSSVCNIVLHPIPRPFRFSPAAVILNCNNNLILVGTRTSSVAKRVKVWRFNPHLPEWIELGVMPDTFLQMLSKPTRRLYDPHRYTGGGNFIYFRHSYGNRVVVLDLSMTDEGGVRLREEAWKEASRCPIGGKGGHFGQLCHDFCYEPRLLMGVPL